jgi:RNA polymerase sigma-70 factor, ECF subfamily
VIGPEGATPDALTDFERHRPRLRGLAYRMLGSVGEAEDLLQEAFLRWHQTDRTAIRSAEAWLVRVTTRLAIDRLRALSAERTAYVGPWLPEPWFEPTDAMADDRPDSRLDLAGDLSMAFLLLLERLSAEERAAFLLHDVFDVGYPQIAATLERSEAACRQMVHRARERVRTDRRRFTASDESRRGLLRQFLAAAEAGDQVQLLALFAPQATYMTDGGGKVWAARRVVEGASRIARLVVGVWRKPRGVTVHRLATINGEPGILTWVDGRPWATLSIVTDGARILAVQRVLNPEKLRHFPEISAVAGSEGG